MKPVVIATPADDNHALAIARIENFLMQAVTKELLVEFILESAKTGKCSYEDVVDFFEVDDVRIYSQCGMPMECGVYAAGEYYCSDECLDEGLGIEDYLELSKDTDTDENCEYYYTEW